MKTEKLTPKQIIMKNGGPKLIAKEVGCTRQHLTQVLNGKSPCSQKLAKMIEVFFDGEITWVDMMSIYDSNN